MLDTAMSIAAVNQLPGVPGGLVRWGGLEPDTAASAAAVNQLPGVPIVPEQWGEIPYFLRKSRQNVGRELNFECRDALPTPLPTRIV